MGLIVDPILLLFRVHLEDASLPSVVVDWDSEPETGYQVGIVGGYTLPDGADHRTPGSGVGSSERLAWPLAPISERSGSRFPSSSILPSSSRGLLRRRDPRIAL